MKKQPKIISLINNSFKIFLIALFILLFSISCKAKQNPKYSELEGTWKSTYYGVEFILNIDSEGNLIFNCGLGNDKGVNWHHNFAGKLADTFEYPYTIELTFTASSLSSVSCYFTINQREYYIRKISELTPKSQIGKFTFHDASTLTDSVIMIGADSYNGEQVYWHGYGYQILNFTKQ